MPLDTSSRTKGKALPIAKEARGGRQKAFCFALDLPYPEEPYMPVVQHPAVLSRLGPRRTRHSRCLVILI
ncbi:hypothetical protein GY45DRAFT_207144 [Cubamyces sp. BRFM 1775]|nr:hypothetical protein GY45DRAFT_207144 [Cubamyces sp. BRFM 1775]